MIVKESAEDYLETVLILKNRKGTVRSVDIAAELRVSKASVCVAMRNLREGGYIYMNHDYEITLTESGQEIAETMYERHLLFSQLLMNLGVSQKQAVRDACRMEHVISAESFQALKEYLLRRGFQSAEEADQKERMAK